MAKFAKISIPAARSSAPVLARRRRVVIGLLVFAITISLFALLSASRSAPVSNGSPNTATPTVAFAEEIARDFLNGETTDVPVATGVDPSFGLPQVGDVVPFQWSGLNLASITPTVFGTPPKEAQLVSYFVQIAQPATVNDQQVLVPKLYRLTVPMIVPLGTYPRLAAIPSLGPVNFNDGSSSVSGIEVSDFLGGKDGASVAPEVKKVISEWAFAYAGGSYADEVLKRITGDQRVDAQYSGMGGWTVDGVTINGVLPPPGGEESPGYVVRVTLAMTPPAGTGPTTETEYDVWVAQEQAGQANPPVIAWGSAGTSQTMTPYQNAVTPQP